MRQTVMSKRAPLVITITLMAAFTVGIVFFSQRPLETEEDHVFDFETVEPEYRTYARLAAREFAKKQGITSIDHAMSGRNVAVERSEGNICISLVVIPPGMGESPIYCYEEGTTHLTRKFDDVE